MGCLATRAVADCLFSCLMRDDLPRTFDSVCRSIVHSPFVLSLNGESGVKNPINLAVPAQILAVPAHAPSVLTRLVKPGSVG